MRPRSSSGNFYGSEIWHEIFWGINFGPVIFSGFDFWPHSIIPALEIRITPPGYLPTYAVTFRGRRKKGRERGKEKSASLFPYPLPLSTPATQAKSWSKNTTVFVSSSDMCLDKKTLLEIWRNPGLTLTIIRRTGPDVYFLFNPIIHYSASTTEPE